MASMTSDQDPDHDHGTPGPPDHQDVRRRLLEAAALLLDEEGPDALSARRLATAAGTSTMAVYTHFGGMPALVRQIVTEGFTRLDEHQAAVPETDDPVADLVALAHAYRLNAVHNPHLYAVMFGATSLKGFQLNQEDLEAGRTTFAVLTRFVSRAIDSGRFRPAEPRQVAAQLWSAMHGFVMLELAGLHLTTSDPVAGVLEPLLDTMIRGLGT
jgi:AcrR family transcriptional regulator